MTRHTYVIVRHGFSLANQSKTIVSDPSNGVMPAYGLTEEGKAQAAKSAQLLKEELAKEGSELGSEENKKKKIYVVSSPFSRAVQTAGIFLDVLAKDGPSSGPSAKARLLNRDMKPDIAYQLCERMFGEYELTSDANYPKVWEEDLVSEHKNSKRVEPLASVWARVSTLLHKCEGTLREPSIILLVSHGDTLQITQTAFSGQSLTAHRSLKHLVQAEWRVLPSPELSGAVLKSIPELSKL